MTPFSSPSYLFYRRSLSHLQPSSFSLPKGFSSEFWSPSLLNWWPKGLSKKLRSSLWTFRFAFRQKNFGAYLIRRDTKVVHVSFFFPSCSAFPFMGENDIQIGACYTDPEYRNRGLFSFALQESMKVLPQQGGFLWYVARENNAPSLHVAEKLGLTLVTDGVRILSPSIGFFGKWQTNPLLRSLSLSYLLLDPYSPSGIPSLVSFLEVVL